ncbi:Carboxylic ester hydrolase [Trichoderma simmonsii]|uniref:Carboxylic ester hydrolase n=1 Tax=Trichoderma simmonsii TaxID=1491479 RepID=A0A8G0PMI3_9HYPO|nr:Carboxylic ester hydrolase [Trichoderma simmonsii]
MVSFKSLLLQLTSLLPIAHGAAIHQRSDDTTQSSPIVDLGYAKYRGVRLDAGVDQFLGMRFAQAPLGNLRFRAPQDPTPEKSIQDASKFGPICVAVSQTADANNAEDCLFVNVFKPSNATPNSNLPVWVYIQGGGYAQNSNSNYNGTEVIKQSGDGLIFVNFNYRVGALGFLASEHVRKDGDLNAGLLDQRKLLHWVQKNIKKFGGNPKHVVIQGASAGAGSVTHHLTAYAAKKDNQLFVGAIPESPFWPTLRTVPDMEFQYHQLLSNTNCSSLNCLRDLDTQALLDAAPNAPFIGAASNNPLPLWYWLPVIDGDLITDHLYNHFERGNFIRVPVLVGDDTNEGTYFAFNATNPSQVSTFLKNNYPYLQESQLKSIIRAYPPDLEPPLPKHAAYFPSAEAAYGESTFTCPGNTVAASVARFFDHRRVWNYHYNVLDPDNVANGLGVPHTFETSAVFGPGYSDSAAASYYTTNAAIVPVTMHYFLSFVTKLNPNAAKYHSAPNWDPWGQGTGQRIRLQTNNTAMEPVPFDQIARCNLWKSLQSYTQM